VTEGLAELAGTADRLLGAEGPLAGIAAHLEGQDAPAGMVAAVDLGEVPGTLSGAKEWETGGERAEVLSALAADAAAPLSAPAEPDAPEASAPAEADDGFLSGFLAEGAAAPDNVLEGLLGEADPFGLDPAPQEGTGSGAGSLFADLLDGGGLSGALVEAELVDGTGAMTAAPDPETDALLNQILDGGTGDAIGTGDAFDALLADPLPDEAGGGIFAATGDGPDAANLLDRSLPDAPGLLDDLDDPAVDET
ncbi:hypothetical protein, partial [Mangrovicoccus algicola]|nr:hypothetical protein [Mangrovicoccus algicola]